jgi:FkbM family methyltransferase
MNLRELEAINQQTLQWVRMPGEELSRQYLVELRKKHPYHGHVEIKMGEQAEIVMACENDDFVALHALWSGSFEPGSLSLWTTLARQGSPLVIDIGAYTGVYSLLAATVAPKSKVWAFEPVPRVFDRLVLNRNLNRRPNLVPLNYAVGCVTGTCDFTIKRMDQVLPTGSSFMHAGSSSPLPGMPSDRLVVDTVELDRLIQERGGPPCRLMKLDVEGAEPLVLAGAKQVLKEQKPDLLIEILNETAYESVIRQLASLGYWSIQVDELGRCYRENEPRFVYENFNFLFTCKAPSALQPILSAANACWSALSYRSLPAEPRPL